MFKTKNIDTKHGFTLVELITVIAIIGILASVVGVSLSGARTRARDQSIMASMQTILFEAALFRGKNDGSYVSTNAFCNDVNILAIRNKIDTENGTQPAPTCLVTNSTTFAVRAPLRSGTYYCVDSKKFFGPARNSFTSGLCTPP